MINVLIADDAPLLRERLASALRDIAGVAKISESVDCVSTLTAISEDRPDIVILDFNFPDGSGLDILHILSASAERPRVIMLSTFGDADIRKRCIDVGAEQFFDKGRDFLAVVDRIREIATEALS